MRIRGALGLAFTIIVLELLVPTVFSELVRTTIVFLHSAQLALSAAGSIAAAAGSIPAH